MKEEFNLGAASKSLTVQSSVLALLVMLSYILKLDIPESVLDNFVQAAIGFGSICMAIYGYLRRRFDWIK